MSRQTTAKDVAPRLYRALHQARLARCDRTVYTAWTAGSSPDYPACFYCGEPVYPGQNRKDWPTGTGMWTRAHAHLASAQVRHFDGRLVA
jgi:hypothetical protein